MERACGQEEGNERIASQRSSLTFWGDVFRGLMRITLTGSRVLFNMAHIK